MCRKHYFKLWARQPACSCPIYAPACRKHEVLAFQFVSEFYGIWARKTQQSWITWPTGLGWYVYGHRDTVQLLSLLDFCPFVHSYLSTSLSSNSICPYLNGGIKYAYYLTALIMVDSWNIDQILSLHDGDMIQGTFRTKMAFLDTCKLIFIRCGFWSILRRHIDSVRDPNRLGLFTPTVTSEQSDSVFESSLR